MKSATLLLLCLSLTASLFSQTTYSKETEAQIKAFENGLAGRVKIEGQPDYNILDRMKQFQVKGLSIAVVHNYQVVWAKGYGWADESEQKPVTANTLFEPGSISKSLNAVGVLKLVQDHKLDLHTDINTYLSSWKFPYDSLAKDKKITLAHLLSHSAGLSVHGFPGYDRKATIPSLPQVLDGVAPANTPAVRSEFEPGLKFQYSGGGTTISQLIVKDVTKQPYDQFMYETVLKPIGMVNSFYSQPPPENKIPLCATGYYGDGSAVPNKFHVYPEQAAAGLWMTPGDLCQYIIETQLAYQGKSAKVLNTEMTKLRLTPYVDPAAALGVFIENRDSTLYFQHSAGNEGFCGIYYGSLEGGNGVAVFINSENFAILPEVVNSVASVYQWKNFYKPVYKKTVSVPESVLQAYPGLYLYDDKWAVIYKKDKDYYFFTDGVDCKMYFSSPLDFFNMEFPADKQFTHDEKGNVNGYLRKVGDVAYPSAVKVANVDTLHLSQGNFNALGWHLIGNKRYPEAISYLHRGLELYPGDLFLLGNLAHGYLFNKQYQAALDIYQAHLGESLNPGFTWQNMIEQDFVFFKRNGFDTAPMDQIFAALKLKTPEGY